jgi:hypothetical protein
MALYTTRISMTAHLSLEATCAKIGKAFDPDVGGERTFYKVYPPEHTLDTPLPATGLATQFYALPEFAASLPYLMASPELLHQSCLLDYETRWPELEPPTFEECVAFTRVATLDIQGENHI